MPDRKKTTQGGKRMTKSMIYNGEQPVGVAKWALADDFVAKRIDGNDRRLTAVEWKSGPHLRIIELVAPFGGEGEMREQVKAGGPVS